MQHFLTWAFVGGLLAGLLIPAQANAQTPAGGPVPAVDKARDWYERLAIRGYVQFRDNQTLFGDNSLVSDGDRLVGPTATFGFRRARLILFGDLSDRVYLYLQPDFAIVPPNGDGAVNFAQLRDLYVDVALDGGKESRLRIGQSKVPFGFENLQSSQNRISLDRNDALNSAVKDERDMGVFYYWAPAAMRARFKHLVDSGLRGSGDYGIVGVGAYAGQGANRVDANNDVHVVGRVTWPHQFPNGQFLEVGAQAYRGRYAVRTSSANAATGAPAIVSEDPTGLADERVAVTAVYYPQPFGLQAEYNVGRGPRLDAAAGRVGVAPLQGGYVQAMYRYEGWGGAYLPFVRWQVYEGGKKAERDAPGATVNDLEVGLEWRPMRELELTVLYARLNRTNTLAAPYVTQQADLLRTQLQWNY